MAAARDTLLADLGLIGDVPDEMSAYLDTLLEQAASDLADAGLMLVPGEPKDEFLTAAYAAWLYRSRVTGAGKPDRLTRMINTRAVNQTTGGTA